MKKVYSFYMIILLGLTIPITSITNVTALSAPSNDPYRIVNTNLQYTFPNGSFYVYEQDMTITTNVSIVTLNGTGGYDVNEMEVRNNNTDYALFQVLIGNTTNSDEIEMTKYLYNNITTVPSSPIRIDEWALQTIQNETINKSLVSIIRGEFWYPYDLHLSDIMDNSTALFQAIAIEAFGVNLLVDSNQTYKTLDDSDNITLYEFGTNVESNVTNNHSGTYDGEFIINFDTITNTSIDLLGILIDLQNGLAVNISVSLMTGLDFIDCYHIANHSMFGICYSIRGVNKTDTNQSLSMVINALIDNVLVDSTLLPCSIYVPLISFLTNWVLILISIIGGLIGGLMIFLTIQRSRCESFKTPLDHVACRIGNKYKK